MSRSNAATTTVSTKGQIVLPSAIRERLGWSAGDKLIVEETPGGVTLRRASPFPPTRLDDVFGMLPRPPRGLSIEEMDAAIGEEVSRRFRGDASD